MRGESIGRPGREAGLTLLELAVSLALAIIVFASIGAAFNALSASATEADRRLLAQAECDRAVLALIEDLQTTNTVETDGAGQPYFRIVDVAPGKADEIVLRRVEGFDADPASDIVSPVYGDPVLYAVDGDGQLIRTQGAEQRVVAARVSELSFSVSATGTIEFRIVTFAGTGEDRVEVDNAVAVTPRNGFDR